MHRFRILAIAACATALLVAGTVTSQAQPPDDTTDPQQPALAGLEAPTIEVNRVAGLLVELAEPFPSVVGTMTIDYATQSILQRYKANDNQASAFEKAVQSLKSGPILITLEATNFTQGDLEAAVLQLYEDSEYAVSVFGSLPQDIGFTDTGLDITLPLGADQAGFDRAAERLGLPTSINVATTAPLPDEAGWQTSGADTSPWSGGARINAPAAGCTSGFVWDKWTTRERMGFTAEHCYILSTQPPVRTWRTLPELSGRSVRPLRINHRMDLPCLKACGHLRPEILLLRL